MSLPGLGGPRWQRLRHLIAADVSATRLLIVALVGAVVGLALGGAGMIVPVVVMVAAASMQALGWRRLAVLLIGSTFVTVFRFNILGANFRLEHLVLLACVVAMVAAGRQRHLIAAAWDRTAVLFAAFVLWSAIVSALRATKPAESLLIVGWLALDWLMLVVLLACGRDAAGLARTGARWAAVAAVVAIILWTSAQAAGTSLGVFNDTGATAASGFSFEPNLLGATMALWAYVALTGLRRMGRRAAAWVVILCTAALSLSLTRAAMVGLGLGVVVWAALAGVRARVRLTRFVVAFAALAAMVVVFAPQVAGPISHNVSDAFDFGGGTGKNRLESWHTAIADMGGLALVAGHGTNSFGQHHFEPTLPTTPTPAYLSNLPLQILYDTGIVGTVLLTAVVASILGRRRIRDGRAVGLIIVYVVCGAATSPFWYGTTWLLVAIAVLDRRDKEPTPNPASQSSALQN